jgi:hypothetical protein
MFPIIVDSRDELAYVKKHFGLDVPSDDVLKEFFRHYYKTLAKERSGMGSWTKELMMHTGMSRVHAERVTDIQFDFLVSVNVIGTPPNEVVHRYPVRRRIGWVCCHAWDDKYNE